MSWFVTGIKNIVGVQERLHNTGFLTVPGIATVSVYTADDAFGTQFVFRDVPKAGYIQTAVYLDLDDEGIETDIVLYSREIVETADHDPYAPSDLDLESLIGHITFADFKNYNANQSSTASGMFFTYTAPLGEIWAQMVTRGIPNIAVAAIPKVSLTIVPQGLWKAGK